MKTSTTPHKILIPLLSLTLLTLPGLSAQDQGTNTPSANQGTNSCENHSGGPWQHHHEKGAWANLTEAERQELKADLKKIHNDPQLAAAREAVKAALKSLQQTRDQLIIQADPAAQAILAKIHQQGTNAPSAQGTPEQ